MEPIPIPTDPPPTLGQFVAFPEKITAYVKKIDGLAAEYNAKPFPVWMLQAMSPNIRKIARLQDKYGYYWPNAPAAILLSKKLVDDENADGWKKHYDDMLTDTDGELNSPGYNVSTLMTFWLLHVRKLEPDIFYSRRLFKT